MTALGPFPVAGTIAAVDAFRQATGVAADGDRLPLTFPMCWLTTPTIRAALLDLVPETDMVLIHESQSFAYSHPLQAERVYHLGLTVRREANPDRLFVDGLVSDESGAEQGRLETILRLIAAPSGQAA